jgi:chromate reductase
MKTYNVGVLVGSLRKESFNKKVANLLVEVAPKNINFEFIEIGNLPLFDEDLDQGNPPQSWANLREKVTNLDAFLFVTPEYNRSVPAALKNALDIASRPWGQNVWSGKPAAVVSVSIGAIGGFGANHHLRQTLAFLNMPTMAQPEAYIGNAMSIFDENRKLINKESEEFYVKFMQAFAQHIDVNTEK